MYAITQDYAVQSYLKDCAFLGLFVNQHEDSGPRSQKSVVSQLNLIQDPVAYLTPSNTLCTLFVSSYRFLDRITRFSLLNVMNRHLVNLLNWQVLIS